MPIYEYQGQQYDISTEDPLEAKNKILAHLGKTTEPVQEITTPRKTSVWEDVKLGVGNAGHMAKDTLDLLAGGLAGTFGDESGRDQIFDDMVARQAAHKKEMQGYDQGVGGQIISGVATAAPMIAGGGLLGGTRLALGAAAGMPALSEATHNVQQGGSTPAVVGQAAIDTGLNYASMALPIGRGIIPGAAIGGSSNIAAGEVSNAIGRQMFEGTDAAKNYESSLEKAAVTGGVGAIIGGGFGRLNRNGALEAKAPKNEAGKGSKDKEYRIDPTEGYTKLDEMAQDRLRRLDEIDQTVPVMRDPETGENVKAYSAEENMERTKLLEEVNELFTAMGKGKEPVTEAETPVRPTEEASVTPDVVTEPVKPKTRNEALDDFDANLDQFQKQKKAFQKLKDKGLITEEELQAHIANQDKAVQDLYKKVSDAEHTPIANKAKPTPQELESLLAGADTAVEVMTRLKDADVGGAGVKYLVNKLLKHPLLQDVSVVIRKPVGKEDTGDFGQYNPNTRHIDLFRNNGEGVTLQTTIHEMFHAVLERELSAGKSKTAKQIQDLYNKIKATVSDDDIKQFGRDYENHGQIIYGMLDVHEFLSEAFTNVKFQEFLATKYIQDVVTKSAWDKLKQIVKQHLGITDKAGITALDQTFDLGGKLFDETARKELARQERFAKQQDENAPPVGENRQLLLFNDQDPANTLAAARPFGAVREAPKDLKELSQEMLYTKDIGSTSANVIGNSFGVLGTAKIYTDNPAIQYFLKAFREGEKIANQALTEIRDGIVGKDVFDKQRTLEKIAEDKSVAMLINRLPDGHLNDVLNTFAKQFRKQEYADTIAQNEGRWTVEQRAFADAVVKAWQLQRVRANDVLYEGRMTALKEWAAKEVIPEMRKNHKGTEEELQGKILKLMERLSETAKRTAIDNVIGWVPGVRRGNYSFTVSLGGIPFRMESFRTKEQAAAMAKRYAEANKDPNVTVSGVEKKLATDNMEQFMEGLQAASQFLKEKHGEAHIDDLIKQIETMGGKIGKHHEYRENLRGAMGDKLYRSEREQAADWRESILSSMEDYSRTMGKLAVGRMVRPLLDATDLKTTHPNTHALIEGLYDHALNRNTRIPEKAEDFRWFHHLINMSDKVREGVDSLAIKAAGKVGKEWYPERVGVFDRAHGLAASLFYITTLTTRPAFWLGQALTSPTAIRQILRDTNIFSAMDSAGRGTANLFGKNKEFQKFLYDVTQVEGSNVLHPNLMNEITRLPGIGTKGDVMERTVKWILGQRPSEIADSFSRLWTLSMMYEHYKKQGLKGKALIDKATLETDGTMVQYSRGYKAPIFDKMGLVGEMNSPLSTFANAQLANLVADFRLFAKKPNAKNSAPLIATFLITSLLGGAIGAPLVAEYELIRKLMISWGWIDPETMPSAVQLLLKQENTTLSHGLPSLTGFDVGSSMRWNPVISGTLTAQESFLNMFPAVAFGAKTASSVALGVKHMISPEKVEDADYRKAALDITPGGYKALVDTAFGSTDRNYIPGGKRGYATVEQTDKEIVGQALGTRSIETAKSSQAMFQNKQDEQRRVQKKQDAMDLLADGVETNNMLKQRYALNQLTKLGVDGKEIEQNLKTIMLNRNIPEWQRYYSGTKGKVTSSEQQRKAMIADEYGMIR